MSIAINLDKVLAERGMKSKELAERIGITQANLSILRSGKAKAVRFSTLSAICKVLECQPGDIIQYEIQKRFDYFRASTDDELQQILQLQRANLAINISSETKQKEGYVTVEHDFELLKRMNNSCPHTIAKDGDKIIGYALSMDNQFQNEIEVLRPMFEQLRLHPVASKLNNFLVMGQVCIDKEYRGKGVFRGLYNFMKQQNIPPYASIVTEIDVLNKRSLEAHYAVGFKRLLQYEVQNKMWVVVQFS